MVRLHVKKGDESQFLYETTVDVKTDDLILDITAIYNARLKVHRICGEMEEMGKYGTFLPPEMLGLTDEQIEELKLVDTFGDTCIPSGGFTMNRDPIGRRNGKQPSSDTLHEMLSRTIAEVKADISKNLVDKNVCLTLKKVQEEINILRGACMIIYPMNLPPHDPIRLEFENKEDLGGTQDSLAVIDVAELWFCGKEIHRGKLLKDFIGSNEKTKVVVKLQKKGAGAPAREPALTAEDQRTLMLFAHRKQEEAKKLAEAEDDDECLNSAWADNSSLKKNFHGIGNVSWRPK